MADLVVKINGDVKGFQKSLGDAGGLVSDFGGIASTGAKVATAAFAALTAAVTYGVHQFHEQEVAVNSLNQALANQNIYTKALSESYQQMAKDIQKTTTYTDDQVIRAEAIIQGMIGQHKITKDLIKATVDLAAAKQMDLASAAELVGKTLSTETNALQRQGIQVNANADITTKMVTVTRALQGAVGGQAEAMAQGTGVIIQAKNSMNDLFKLIGDKAMPALEPLFKGMKQMFDTLSDSKEFKEFLKQMFGAMKGTFEQMGALMTTFGDNFGGFAKAMGLLWKAIWDKETAVQSFKEAWQAIKDFSLQSYEEYKEIREDQIAEDIEIEKRGEQKKVEVKNNAHNEALALSQAQEEEKRAQRDVFNKALLDQDAEYRNLSAAQKKIFDEQDRQNLQNQMLTEDSAKRAYLNQQLQVDIKAHNTNLLEQQKYGKAFAAINQAIHSEEFQGAKNAFSNLQELTQSHNQIMKSIGKVASIASIIIHTAESAVAIFRGFVDLLGPFGIAPGIAGAAAAVAFGAEQISRVQGAAEGGIVGGGIPGRDSSLVMAMPGELFVPTKNFDEVVNAVADRRNRDSGSISGEGGQFQILIGLDGKEAEQVLTVRQNEARALGISREVV